MKEVLLKLFTDGACRGHPGGKSSAGVYIPEMDARAGHFLGMRTNNEAEYEALHFGLQIASAMGVRELEIFADSQLMVNQIIGRFQCKHPTMAIYRDIVMTTLESNFQAWSITYVNREQNRFADRICNQVLDDVLHGALREGFGGFADLVGLVRPTLSEYADQLSAQLLNF